MDAFKAEAPSLGSVLTQPDDLDERIALRILGRLGKPHEATVRASANRFERCNHGPMGEKFAQVHGVPDLFIRNGADNCFQNPTG